MDVTEKELTLVEELLSKQNALKAAIFSSLWSVIIICLWYYAYTIQPDFASAFIIFSGLLIGGLVRFHGRGFTALFSGIAFVLHLLIILSAILLDILLPPGSIAWASVLLAMYGIGAWLSTYVARMQVPFALHRAFFKLTEIDVHPHTKRLKNHWFIVLPLLLPLGSGLMFFSSSFL